MKTTDACNGNVFSGYEAEMLTLATSSSTRNISEGDYLKLAQSGLMPVTRTNVKIILTLFTKHLL